MRERTRDTKTNKGPRQSPLKVSTDFDFHGDLPGFLKIISAWSPLTIPGDQDLGLIGF